MKKIVLTFVAAVALSSLVFCLISGGNGRGGEPESRVKVLTNRIQTVTRADFLKRRAERIQIDDQSAQIDISAFEDKKKPVLEEVKEEEKLTELQREILTELKSAFDANDKAAVLAIVQRMQSFASSASAEGGRGVGKGDWTSYFPASIRRMAVQALGWFGADSLPELAAFIADPDPVVADLALQQVESVLTDIELGDRELSPQIISLLSVIDNPMAVESLMSSIPMRMRNSVGIETIIGIADTGTDVALEKLPETIRFFTGDSSIETVEAAQAWLASHPDSEFDDQMYGSIKAFFGNVDLVPVKVSDLPK